MSTVPATEHIMGNNTDKLLGLQNLSISDQSSSTVSAPNSTGTTTPNMQENTPTLHPTGVVRTPFPQALPSCKPVERPALTSEQSTKYSSVLEAVSEWTELPTTTARNSPKSALSDNERMWLTRECILRYLRATNWSTVNAIKRLSDTLIWRREYGVEQITAELVSEENETGKQVLLGFDNRARPCLYMNPGKQNTKKSERQIQHLVYMLERAIDLMGPGQETSALIISFKHTSSGGGPSVGQGRQTMTILQGHYPERLGSALISELPWFVTTFFRLISPFIDPVTKEKMNFNPDLLKFLPPAQLDKELGGEVDFKYDHSVYWPALDQICADKRAAYTKCWIDGGKMIGEYETYLRGGEQKSISQVSLGNGSA